MSETPVMKSDPVPWEGGTGVKPTFFTMRAQLLDSGNTETPLAVGEHLWLKIKVYAKGRSSCRLCRHRGSFQRS